MATLSYRTAGESHGPGLFALVDGLPAGLEIDQGFVDAELRRRQGGYGRGGRQKLETDHCEYLSGVRLGKTTGAPVMLKVPNRDCRLDDVDRTPPLHRPRPGHADLAGSVKWLTTDCRDTLERASARETSARVAAGAVSRCLLRHFEIEAFAFVRAVGPADGAFDVSPDNWRELRDKRDANDLYCPDADAAEQMRAFIRDQKMAKDTAGGIVECHVFGCPVGIGSSMNWFDKLDARLGAAVLGIQAFKGLEIGLGFETARRPGSQVHDEIFYNAEQADGPTLGFSRGSNNAGGLEGGMTNGQPVIVRAAMKPISTLGKPLRSVDLNTKQPESAGWERSDISAISAASVVLENVVAFEIASAFVAKFGGDSMTEVHTNYRNYLSAARQLPAARDASIT
jgi:chorismate synthase